MVAEISLHLPDKRGPTDLDSWTMLTARGKVGAEVFLSFV